MGGIIVKTNIISLTIFIVVTTIIIIAVNPGKKNVIFVEKKNCYSNKHSDNKQWKVKNFGDKIENSVKIKVNIMHFWLIMNKIQMMTLRISIKKQII